VTSSAYGRGAVFGVKDEGELSVLVDDVVKRGYRSKLYLDVVKLPLCTKREPIDAVNW
jgi:hypothetical protein